MSTNREKIPSSVVEILDTKVSNAASAVSETSIQRSSTPNALQLTPAATL
jgi:hypothetical protein